MNKNANKLKELLGMPMDMMTKTSKSAKKNNSKVAKKKTSKKGAVKC